MKSKNVLTKFQQSLPNHTKKRIVKEIIDMFYPWLNDHEFAIDDSFMPEYVKKLKASYKENDNNEKTN